MGLEIERKFLVKNDLWKADAQRGIPMLQGYISATPVHTVRLRIAGDTGYLTLKGGHQGISRKEFEYPVPVSDAREMFDLFCPIETRIVKTRYPVEVAGHLWTVDCFEGSNAGLVIAEIELQREDEPFVMPEWAGVEVSGDGRYTNAALSFRPFKDWPENKIEEKSNT